MPRLCLPRNVRIRMERLPRVRNVTKSRRNSMIRLELSPLLMPTTSRREDYVVVQPLVTKRADGSIYTCLPAALIYVSLGGVCRLVSFYLSSKEGTGRVSDH